MLLGKGVEGVVYSLNGINDIAFKRALFYKDELTKQSFCSENYIYIKGTYCIYIITN